MTNPLDTSQPALHVLLVIVTLAGAMENVGQQLPCFSYAPISAGSATVNARGMPSRSVEGAPVLVPALIAGEPHGKCRSADDTKGDKMVVRLLLPV